MKPIQRQTTFDLNSCSFLKPVMMIVVIIYHTISLWNGYGWHGHPRNPSVLLEFVCTFLNTIHIYVFTFLSGYIYYVLLTENNKYSHKMSAIQARAKRLLVPYSLTLLMIIPIVCWLEKPSLDALLQKYILGVEPSQLWFLLMLFLVQVTFILLGKCVYDKWKISLLVMVGVHCFGWLGGVLTKNYFQNQLPYPYRCHQRKSDSTGNYQATNQFCLCQ